MELFFHNSVQLLKLNLALMTIKQKYCVFCTHIKSKILTVALDIMIRLKLISCTV